MDAFPDPLGEAGSAVVYRSCPICGTDNRRVETNRYSRDGWALKECAGCSLVYLENALTYAALTTQFAWEKTSAAEAAHRKKSRPLRYALSAGAKRIRAWVRRDKLLKLIRLYVPPGKLLDVGCGGGALFERLAPYYRPFGIEISERLAAIAHEAAARREGEVLQGEALSRLQSLPDDSFSGIVLNSFLEHEINPLPVLQQCKRLLRPDGAMIIKVPNYGSLNRKLFGAQWCGFRFPDHVNYFTPRHLSDLCRRAGLAPVRFRYLDRHPLSDNMWLVLGR